jgi:hypothetical protein
VPAEAVRAFSPDQPSRLMIIRSVSDVKPTIGMLNADLPLLVVIRADEPDRRRIIDLLAGWTLGSGGESDRIGPNAFLLSRPGSAPIHLGRAGLASAVEDAFASEGDRPITRTEEEVLLPRAVNGSVTARRRIIDSYSELATMYALRIRPKSISESATVRMAQAELERLVTFPSTGPILANLFEGINKLLLS